MIPSQPPYHKLLEPLADVTTSVEALLDGAFGRLMGDQREALKRVYRQAWGLHTLFMDVITALGIENIAQRPALRARFDAFVAEIDHNAHALLDGVDGPLSEEQRVSVAFIAETAAQLRRYVQQLWCYSTLHHDKQASTLRSFSLADDLDPLRLPVTAAPVDLHLLLPSDLPPITADADLLHMALSQVVQNAIIATRHTPHARIDITAAASREHVALTVHDNGRGIAATHHPRLMEAFYQCHADDAGLGLGLAITQALLHLQGGEVAIDSAPQRGTTVTLRWQRRS